MPKEVTELLQIVPLRQVAIKLGIEKLVLKSNVLMVYLVSDQESLYYQSPQFHFMMQQIQGKNNCKIQEKNNKLMLVFKDVKNVQQAYGLLESFVGN